MNKKAQDAIKKYKDACNSLASIVNDQLFDGLREWYWVSDDVGGICDFDDRDFLTPEDMVLIIENNMTYKQYEEWLNANIENEKYINLRSWLMGARHNMIQNEKDTRRTNE